MTGLTHRVLGAEVGLGVASVGVAAHPWIPTAIFGVPSTIEIPILWWVIVISAGFIYALEVAGVIAAAISLGTLAAVLPDWDLRLHIPHRGPTHSVIVCAILTVGAAVAASFVMPPAVLLVAVVVGLALLSHLLADLTNKTPMALLWPVRRKRLRPRWLPYALEDSWKGHVVEAVAITCVAILILPGILEWLR